MKSICNSKKNSRYTKNILMRKKNLIFLKKDKKRVFKERRNKKNIDIAENK